MSVLGLIFMATMFIMVGNILKPAGSKKMKQINRIRYAGKLRRVCDSHRYLLEKTHMAILDKENCDYCVKIQHLTVIK